VLTNNDTTTLTLQANLSHQTQLDYPGLPAVGTLDKSGFLQPVHHAAQRDRLNFNEVREAALIDSFMAPQHRQHAPLGTRKSTAPRPFIKGAAHQMRHVRYHCSKIIWFRHARHIIAMLIIGNLLNVDWFVGVLSKPADTDAAVRLRT
jgi:hypothetical protein